MWQKERERGRERETERDRETETKRQRELKKGVANKESVQLDIGNIP